MAASPLNRLPRGLGAKLALVLLASLFVAPVLSAPRAGATDVDRLESRLAAARSEASQIASSLQASKQELLDAQSQAEAAEARERRLSGLLAEGQRRTAQLSAKLQRTREQLQIERRRLRRARAALAARLVAIYEGGTPDTTSLVLGSSDYGDLLTQADYLNAIAESDRALADRVEQVRREVSRHLARVDELHERAVAHEERLAAARSRIASVRAAAQAAAAQLSSLSASREASLAELRADIERWVDEVRRVRAAEARAASEAEAEEEVGRWLGGPYSIPTYIVMCESGGNYGALNPSSGAGGAYQIIPSTWEAYGGQGAPHEAPKAEQDRIAAQIWADSGGSAWVCA